MLTSPVIIPIMSLYYLLRNHKGRDDYLKVGGPLNASGECNYVLERLYASAISRPAAIEGFMSSEHLTIAPTDTKYYLAPGQVRTNHETATSTA